VGFVLGAGATGLAVDAAGEGMTRGIAAVAAGAVVAHILILGAGWVGLASDLGPAGAWRAGVSPVQVGGVVKSVAAGLLWPLLAPLRAWFFGDVPRQPGQLHSS
jgi:biotin transporter BioY